MQPPDDLWVPGALERQEQLHSAFASALSGNAEPLETYFQRYEKLNGATDYQLKSNGITFTRFASTGEWRLTEHPLLKRSTLLLEVPGKKKRSRNGRHLH